MGGIGGSSGALALPTRMGGFGLAAFGGLSQTASARILLAGWVLAVVGGFYAQAVFADPGILTVSDDAMLLQAAGEGLAPQVLFSAHGDHLVPLQRIAYFLCLHLFGTDWFAYGCLLLAAFSAMCWLVGVLLHRVTGSLFIALLILVPFSLSPLLASAPTLQFTYFFSMAQMSLCLTAVLVLVNRAEAPKPRHLPTIGGCAGASALTSSPGLIILPLIWLCAFALRFARIEAGRSFRAVAKELFDLPLLRTLALVAAVYGAAYAFGAYGLGNKPLASTSYDRKPSPVRPVKRVINFYRYGFFGAVAPAAAGDEVFELGFVWSGGDYRKAPKILVFLIVGVVVLLIADVAVKRLVGERNRPPASELALAFLAIGLLFAILAVRARVNIYFWQAVYVEPIVIFSAIGIGLFMAAAADRLTGRVRIAAGALAASGLSLGAWQNALYLKTRVDECVQLRAEAVSNGRAPGAVPRG